MLRTSGRGWAEPTLEGAGEPRVEMAVAPVAVYEALVIIGNIIDKANRLRNAAAGVAAGGAVGTLLNEDNADDAEEEQNPAEEDAPDTDNTAPDNDPEGEGPEEDIFRRPDGVPEEWIRKKSKKGDGVKYIDPDNPHNDIRIQKGNPNSKWKNSQEDYIRWKRDGQWLDRNGKPSSDPEKTHIPIKNFRFNPEFLK